MSLLFSSGCVFSKRYFEGRDLGSNHTSDADQLGRRNPLFHEHKQRLLEPGGDIHL